MNLRTIGKIGFLLVIIGFFMPVACDENGFGLAKFFIDDGGREIIFGILMYLVFINAIFGIILGVILLQKREVNITLDWLCLIACIASGLIVFFSQLQDLPELQSGAYMILTGWIIAFLSLIIPNSEEKELPEAKNKYAKASLILGIIGLFFPLSSIIGLIMGIKGIKSLKRNMAITGLILSIIGIVLSFVVITFLLISK
jgi:hypothetical protein